MTHESDISDTEGLNLESNPQNIPRGNGRATHTHERNRAASRLNSEDDDFDVIKTVQAALRGRYGRMIAAGILCGAILGYAGWRFGHQTYHSSGLVRIAFELPKVMTDTDQNSPIQMFDTFMQSQRLLIASRRVLDVALQDPIWRTTGRPVPTDPDDYFAHHFKVEISPRSEFIEIVVSDTDPGTAYAAASSVVSAYQQLYNLQEEQLEKNRIGVLDDKQKMIEGDIQQLSGQILSGAQEFGSSDLDLFFENAFERVNVAKATLERVRTEMAMAGPDSGPSHTSDHGPTTAPVQMSVLQIAAADDGTMRSYLNQKSQLEDELKTMSIKLGREHDSVKGKRLEIENITQRIDGYAESFNALHPNGMQNREESAGGVTVLGASAGDLLLSEARLEKVVDREQKEMVAIGNKRLQLQQMHNELADKQKENEELLHRISVLRAERSLGGRLSVTSTPEIPLTPDKDQRLLYASAGTLAGLGFPVAMVLAIALLRPGKFRFVGDTTGPLDATIPMLGILPTIPNRSSTYEDFSEAAHSIHQLRVTLRSIAPPQRTSSVYLVTSSTAGEGKTSLAMSLALSLAAAGHRTLIIDCDMIGRHLTTNLKMQNRRGLKEAMASGTLRQMLHEVNKKLYALPVGQITRGDAFALSPVRLTPLLDTARKYFDTVLIDTGPVLGSVEAAVLAQEVDGVVFVIGRDQQRPLVDRALQRLNHLGAKIEGFVFNRARRSDFHSSVYASSSTRLAWDEQGTPRLPTGPIVTPFDDFGPLVKSILKGMPDQETSLDAGTRRHVTPSAIRGIAKTK